MAKLHFHWVVEVPEGISEIPAGLFTLGNEAETYFTAFALDFNNRFLAYTETRLWQKTGAFDVKVAGRKGKGAPEVPEIEPPEIPEEPSEPVEAEDGGGL